MSLIALVAMVRKDLQVYYSDRRAVIMGFVVPITIASFMGSVFGGVGQREPSKIAVAIVDLDGSAVSKAIVAEASVDRSLDVSVPGVEEARAAVGRGTLAVAVTIPQGFAAGARQALLGGGAKPDLDILYDPSRSAEFGMVRGILTGHILEAVTRDAFGSTAGLRLPYAVHAEAATSQRTPFNFYAHAFAGMSIQFLLFAMIDLGVAILLERQRGLWKRLRSAPISRQLLLGARTISGSSVALLILFVSFAFAGLVFGVRIHGSIPGFVLVCLGSALMASTFGLLVASIGGTPGGSRGVASLAVLVMVMFGGAWMPAFLFPAWLQRFTFLFPTRWAIDGLDAMTWRGLAFSDALVTTGVLIGFAALFGALATMRFKWEEA